MKRNRTTDDYKTWVIVIEAENSSDTFDMLRFFDTETAEQARQEGSDMILNFGPANGTTFKLHGVELAKSYCKKLMMQFS